MIHKLYDIIYIIQYRHIISATGGIHRIQYITVTVYHILYMLNRVTNGKLQKQLRLQISRSDKLFSTQSFLCHNHQVVTPE